MRKKLFEAKTLPSNLQKALTVQGGGGGVQVGAKEEGVVEIWGEVGMLSIFLHIFSMLLLGLKIYQH